MDKKKILEKKINYNYDRKADVLYVSFGKPQKAICVQKGDGILLRVDPFRDKIVGITVLDFKERFSYPSKKNVIEFTRNKLEEFGKWIVN